MIPLGCNSDLFSRCVEQSRESWRASRRQLVSCLGERTEQQLQQQRHTPSITTDISLKVEDSPQPRNMISLNTRLETVECGNQVGWSECFQDLQSWCPNAQDELNTPQVNLQDGFNFSAGFFQAKDVLSPVDMMDEPWGNDLLFTIKKNNNIDDDEDRNNNNNSVQLSNIKLPEFNYDYSGKSPLLSAEKGKIMLSQTSLAYKRQVSPCDISTSAASAPSSTVNLDTTNTTQARSTSRARTTTAVAATAGQRDKPKLKLDIAAASSSKVQSLSTPEVLQQLVDSTAAGGGFDLVSYLDSSEACGNDLENEKETVVPASKVATQDHDYAHSIQLVEPPAEIPVIKTEPMSPEPAMTTTTSTATSRGRPIKRKTSDSQPDYVFDDDTGISDNSTDWSPSSSLTSSRNKRGGGRAKKAKVQAASKSPSSTYSTGRRSSRRESDADSVVSAMSGNDKYRELRDKNNEASRRSRMNRKQRDYEMRRAAMNLEKENVALKIKAERMENLVQELRATILKTLSNSRKH